MSLFLSLCVSLFLPLFLRFFLFVSFSSPFFFIPFSFYFSIPFFPSSKFLLLLCSRTGLGGLYFSDLTLRGSFPAFYYGRVLKFSELFRDTEIYEGPLNSKPAPASVQQLEYPVATDEQTTFASYQVPAAEAAMLTHPRSVSPTNRPIERADETGRQTRLARSPCGFGATCPVVAVSWEEAVNWDGYDAAEQPCCCGKRLSFESAEPRIVCVHCARCFHAACLDLLAELEMPRDRYYCSQCTMHRPRSPPPPALPPRPAPRPETVTGAPRKKPGPKTNKVAERALARKAISVNGDGGGGGAAKMSGSIDQAGPAAPRKPPTPAKSKPVEQSEKSAEKGDLVGIVVPKALAVSKFPPAHHELLSGTWIDSILWDGPPTRGAAAAAEPGSNARTLPAVLLDLNDPHMFFDATVRKPRPTRGIKKIQQLTGRNRIPTWKLKRMEQEEREKAKLRASGRLPPPNDPNDPFRLGNDTAYQPPEGAATTFALAKELDKRIVEHAKLVSTLDPFCIPTQLTEHDLRNFHRPKIQGDADSVFHAVMSVASRAALKSKKDTKSIMVGAGMRKKDITARDNCRLILAEYCEQHPPLLAKPGMGVLIRNYYRQADTSDTQTPKFPHGVMALIGPKDASPFLGALKPRESLQSFENNMFRAPVYGHKLAPTDFLLIRTKRNYYIREVEALYVVGQECPKIEVPAPNSKKAIGFLRDRLSVFIQRLFMVGDSVRVEDIRRAFPSYTEGNVRRRLKEVGEFRRGGVKLDDESSSPFDTGAWEWRANVKQKSEVELRSMVLPEHVCAFESMLANQQRLVDMGYGQQSLEDVAQEYEDNPDVLQPDDEAKMAHWRTTSDFLDCVHGKCLLAVTGPAEPTGIGEGFSYLRLANKPVPTSAALPNKLMPNLPTPKKSLLGTLSGTDKDLRRLKLKEAYTLLAEKHGYDMKYLRTLTRWEVIDLVRTKSTQVAEANEMEHIFARGQRSTIHEHQERFKSESQRVFELQNRRLASDEVLSTDEEDDDEDSSDVEAQAKQLESALGTGNEELQRARREKEEEAARQEIQEILKAKAVGKTNTATAAAAVAAAATGPPVPKKLVITRTYFNSENEPFKRVQIVRDPRTIKAYLHATSRKGKHYIDLQGDALDSKLHLRRERKKLTEKLGRLRKLESSGGADKANKLRCGACGAVGHIRTNTICPLRQVGTAEEERADSPYNQDGMVKMEGMKMTFNKSMLEEEAQRLRKRKLRELSEEFDERDYGPSKRTERSRRNPDVSLNSLLEDVLQETHSFENAYWFSDPVKKAHVPDYYDIVENPMDLATMRERARALEYRSRHDFLDDVRQIVVNCQLYNGIASPLYSSAIGYTRT